jgi:hypothetical protein
LRRRRVALVLLLASVAAAQTAPEKPYVERVEVNVRTVLVRITDRDGRGPSPPPGPEDIEVVEDGVVMQVLGVDPARPPATPSAAQTAVSSAPAREPAAAPPAASPSAGIPQHLYVETTLLEPSSVKRLAVNFEKNIDAILANGTLEIVVADPQPRQFLQASRDPQAVRRALEELGRGVSGKQSLILQRRQAIDQMRSAVCPNTLQNIVRTAAEQELRIIQDALHRLVQWGVSLGGQRPDVVYFVSDGFDSNVTLTYIQVIRQLALLPRSAFCPPIDLNQVAAELQSEYAPQGAELVGQAARALAALNVEAVPVALGGNLKDFGNDASTPGQDNFQAAFGSIPLFAQPIDALRTLAEPTGGEVVTAAGQLPAALGGFDSSFVVSFRSEHSADGKIHDLRVTSKRAALTIRSPQYMTEGTPDSVAKGVAVRALREPAAESGIPVRLTIDGVAQSGKESMGMLHVDADLASLVSTLVHLDGGRMRVTIAVEVQNAREPFTTSQEFDVLKNQAAFGADIPIRWPAKGRKVAVTVEELKTGTRGTATIDLPK